MVLPLLTGPSREAQAAWGTEFCFAPVKLEVPARCPRGDPTEGAACASLELRGM